MKPLNFKSTVVIFLILIGYVSGYAQNSAPKIDDKVRAEQIREMKFGMFICW